MTDSEERQDRKAIYVPDDVAEAAAVPEDLDSDVPGPYMIPDTARRRRAGYVYFAGAAATGAAIVAGLPALMWATAVAVLVASGVYHLVAGWRLAVREGPALEIAGRDVGFAVGHSSASLGFRGWRARPVWNVLVFNADEPPTERGLVRVDGIDGTIVEHYREAIEPPPAGGAPGG